MTTVERTVTTPVPQERAWEYLHDFSHAVDWDPPTESCERVAGDGGVGTQYRNVSSFLGASTEVLYEVVSMDAPHSFQLKGDAGDSLDLLDTITLAPTDDGGTAVTYRAEFKPHGAGKLAAPLLPPALELLAQRVASSLEDTLRSL